MHLNIAILTATSALLAPLLLSAPQAKKDIITLKNGNVITGSINNSDTPGVYVIDYPEAVKPLKIKEASIKTIRFATSDKKIANQQENLLLTNGDYFSCQIISLDNKQISFNSSYLGKHSIPRSAVTAIRFNNSAKNKLYSGPGENLNDWTIPNTADANSWKVRNNTLINTKRAKISKDIKNLSNNYAIEMDFRWTGKTPNFKLFFSAESNNIGKRPDSYYLAINSQGFVLTRYAKKRYLGLGNVLAEGNTFANKKASLSLYVNRDQSTITLFYNGKKIKVFKDGKTPPKGSILLIATQQRRGESLIITKLTVSNWSGGAIMGNPRFADDLKSNDILVDDQGNPMTGTLTSITKVNNKPKINFSIKFAKKPINIPLKKIQQIALKRQQPQAQLEKTNFSAQLKFSGGKLSFSQSQVTNSQLKIHHPILGDIQIDRNYIKKIQATPTTQDH